MGPSGASGLRGRIDLMLSFLLEHFLRAHEGAAVFSLPLGKMKVLILLSCTLPFRVLTSLPLLTYRSLLFLRLLIQPISLEGPVKGKM